MNEVIVLKERYIAEKEEALKQEGNNIEFRAKFLIMEKGFLVLIVLAVFLGVVSTYTG